MGTPERRGLVQTSKPHAVSETPNQPFCQVGTPLSSLLCYAVLCCAVLCYAVLCCAVLCCATLYHAAPSHGSTAPVLCSVAPGCAVIVLCCDVLCCAVLRCLTTGLLGGVLCATFSSATQRLDWAAPAVKQ